MTNDQINRMIDASRALAEIVMQQCGGYMSGPGFAAAEKARAMMAVLSTGHRQGRLSDPENKPAMDAEIAKLESEPAEAARFLRDIGFDAEAAGLTACVTCGAPAGVHAEPAGDASMPAIGRALIEDGCVHIAPTIRDADVAGLTQGGLVARQRDAQAAIAARDAEVAAMRERVWFHVAMTRNAQEVAAAAQKRVRELEDALQTSGKSVVRFSEAWKTAQMRVLELESEVGRLTDLTINQQIAECEQANIAAEYAEAYARAQAQAAFWVWHALTHGRAPDMVPQEFQRPGFRIVWVNDANAIKPAELMTPAELEEAYAASAAEMPQLDHNWRTGQPADPPEVVDSMMRRKMAPQKLDQDWDPKP